MNKQRTLDELAIACTVPASLDLGYKAVSDATLMAARVFNYKGSPYLPLDNPIEVLVAGNTSFVVEKAVDSIRDYGR